MVEGKKILYLEDQALVAYDIGDHLETLSFDVVEVAMRLDAATKAAAAKHFDIALLDINVDKGQNSIDLGRSLAAAGTRVIFATGNGHDRERLVAEGFEFIDKPFSTAQLDAQLQLPADG